MKIIPFYIYFVTHLICASPAKIKAAKSQICVIDRANINTRGDTPYVHIIRHPTAKTPSSGAQGLLHLETYPTRDSGPQMFIPLADSTQSMIKITQNNALIVSKSVGMSLLGPSPRSSPRRRNCRGCYFNLIRCSLCLVCKSGRFDLLYINKHKGESRIGNWLGLRSTRA